jgi:hypothetical protein
MAVEPVPLLVTASLARVSLSLAIRTCHPQRTGDLDHFLDQLLVRVLGA